MSIRRKRTNANLIVADRLEQLREQITQDTELAEALALAKAALAEEPRSLTTCDLLLEYLPISSWQCEKAHCSECSGVIVGWDSKFRFCPLCGSRVQKAERETSPHERLQRQAVAEAVSSLNF